MVVSFERILYCHCWPSNQWAHKAESARLIATRSTFNYTRLMPLILMEYAISADCDLGFDMHKTAASWQKSVN